MTLRAPLVLALLVLLVAPSGAAAHGSMSSPLSRVLGCYREGPESPTSPSCRAAKAVTGSPQPFYDWNEVNLPDPAGQHRQRIPDGQLCSAGRAKYAGLDLPRADWRATPLQPGATTFRFAATAPHRGTFELFLTRQGYDPTRPLRWDDLEAAPFARVTDPAVVDGAYDLPVTVPGGHSGRQLVYAIWQRSDSPEAFYSCSDVTFGDGPPAPADTTAPSVPADLRATGATTSSVTLAWSAATDDTGVLAYDVLRDGTRVVSVSSPGAVVTGLPAGTSSRFTVVARDAAGNASAASAAVVARTLDPPPPSQPDTQAPTAPADLHAMGSTPTSVTLMWSAAADDVGVTGYEVLRDGAVVASTAATTVTVSGLQPATNHSFTVRARDVAGNRSAPSTPVTVRTPEAPPSGGTCAAFTTTSDWGTGYVGQVTVTNPGPTPVTGWRLELELPLTSTITSAWSAKLTRTGTRVVATPESWTATIPARGKVTFGFQVDGSAKPRCTGCC